LATAEWPIPLTLELAAGPWVDAVTWSGVERSAEEFRSIDWRQSCNEETPLERVARLPDLAPFWRSQPERQRRVHALVRRLLPHSQSKPDVIALRAALLLPFDDLDAAHRESQSIEGLGRHLAGDCWHAIMHRREPDYGNSRYWWRAVGRQPFFERIAEFAAMLPPDSPSLSSSESVVSSSSSASLREEQLSGTWDPNRFVEAVAAAERSRDVEQQAVLKRIQFAEFCALWRSTWEDAAAA
jgi:hypothetical protein